MEKADSEGSSLLNRNVVYGNERPEDRSEIDDSFPYSSTSKQEEEIQPRTIIGHIIIHQPTFDKKHAIGNPNIIMRLR